MAFWNKKAQRTRIADLEDELRRVERRLEDLDDSYTRFRARVAARQRREVSEETPVKDRFDLANQPTDPLSARMLRDRALERAKRNSVRDTTSQETSSEMSSLPLDPLFRTFP
jgi:hypothetical protein